MSESKHTPGPWIVDAAPSRLPQVISQSAPHLAVADRIFNHNEHLIAAAPDLLAALEEIVARNEIQHWFNLDQARAAIAKAKGEK